MEQLTIRACANLIHDGRLKVHEHATRHVLARAGLREERVESVVSAADSLVRRHLAVRLNAVLQAEELPARVTNLAPRLSHMNQNGLTHGSTCVSTKECGRLCQVTRA